MAELNSESQIEVQNKFAEKLTGLFDYVIKEREEYYKKNVNKIPQNRDVKSIISSYSYTNAMITGGLSLIPGPLGLIAAIPEITLVIKNQISMVYDIGLAYGKEKQLKKEVLMYIVASAMGSATGTLAIMHGSKLIIKRASLKVMQQLVKKLAGSVLQKILKSMVAKWFPVLGAVVMATWTKFSTSAVGNKAADIFEKEIVYDSSDELIELEADTETENVLTEEISTIEIEKILCFISLIKIDGNIHDEEIKFVKPFIEHLEVSEEKKESLLNLANSKDKANFNLDLFRDNPNESITLIIDLIALAKRDNEFHATEKMFIKQLAKQLGYSADDIEELL